MSNFREAAEDEQPAAADAAQAYVMLRQLRLTHDDCRATSEIAAASMPVETALSPLKSSGMTGGRPAARLSDGIARWRASTRRVGRGSSPNTSNIERVTLGDSGETARYAFIADTLAPVA